MPTLTSYTSVKTNLFVKLVVAEYRTTSSAAFAPQTLLFTDSDQTVAIGSDTYTPLGEFLNVTPTTSELRPTSDQITLTLSGVPTASIPEVLFSKIKGSKVEIRRQFRDGNNLLGTQGYFFGRVNNFSLQEDYSVEERSATNIILLECANYLSILNDKISGRLTNPNSNKRFFPNDTGMDRVPIIKGTKLDFGAP